MSNYAIIADSTCDLTPELCKLYNIDYFRMIFSDGDVNYNASLGWEELESETFYNKMREGTSFKTSQVPVKNFLEKFESYLENGQDVLYIACSSALSASINAAGLVAKQVVLKYPGRKIVCVDTLISGMAQGLIAIKAASLRAAGMDIDGAANWIEENKLFYNQYGTVQSLEYLKKAGRVTASSAFFGTLFAVKPMLISDSKGQNVAIKKVKGRNASLEETADYVAEHIINPADQIIYVANAGCVEDAHKVADLLRERLGDVKIEISTIGPIVGASVGPGTIIVYYYGTNRKEQEPA